ncbi:cell division protein ZapA [Parvularcula lutaonensis]|uniref:Cell division protein ZapA n=1 Tax=Parvularcula lutaonensis TaxID=491923 RepID=A0ABV7MA54_9PROT|nr:cell division protein ZapA [Parvularcula lutaonensis]GGY45028.1 hypothetical protein GCM10007148_12490 [Parvularcula lutaonensis]
MAEISVEINGREHKLTCDDGQEARARKLAEIFDKRVQDVRAKHDGLSDSQALVVAALAILDEYDEAKNRWSTMTPEGAAAEWAADRLDEASERLEKLLAEIA